MNIVKRFINHINSEIQRYGLIKAAARFLKLGEVVVKSVGMTGKLRAICTTQPVLFVANHPFELESLALLASLPDRDNIRLIVNSHFYGIFSAADKYLIPAYIDHHSNRGPSSWPFTLLGMLFSKQKEIPEFEAHKKNVESIKSASAAIDKGNAVVIFPERRGSDRSWYSGIGHLIHGTRNPEKAYLVRVFVRGSSKYDLLRVFPFLRRFFPAVTVTFAPALPLPTCIKQTPKLTAHELEQNYLVYFTHNQQS